MCATAAVFIIRGTSAENLIFVCLAIFAAALVGLAALNALRPLATGETREPEMVGGHTRAAIEREKNMVLRSIKELEFDRAMGKLDEQDYEEMSARLRSRAVRLMQQLDNTSSGYRELIERELASRLVKAGSSTKVEPYASHEPDQESEPAAPAGQQVSVGLDFVELGVCASCAPSTTTTRSSANRAALSCWRSCSPSLFLFRFSFFLSRHPPSSRCPIPGRWRAFRGRSPICPPVAYPFG